ncbi:hypothetical protein ES319_D03G118800v1 [Gossypium barbadense]|uniref:Uncharacterized protein n=2 Tax=Gossypium TaxID=3633 RepID=A0A5J5SAJ0_GOSBA|nr:hypothetical protein ES319_D03G118800v1 [Gossypium barbadense]TYG76633.1 hypothetical protein ES288_D03G128700v1 [Gossypium darwinii]
MTSFGTTIITITTNKPSPLIPFLIGLVISTSSLPPKPISLTHTTAFRSPIPLLSTAPICSIAARTKSTSSSISSTNASNNLRFGDSMWIVGFRSDSEGDDGDDYSIDDHVNDCCDVGANDDVSVSIPLFWDSLQLEDRWETIEDFEWEEMDGRVDYNAVME